MAEKEKKTIDLIKQTTKKLLDLLEIKADLKLKKDKEGVVHVKIETTDSGLLIGRYGETLNSLQLILGLMIYNQLKEWQKIIVDVGDYREKRKEQLEKMALEVAEKVKRLNQPQVLPPLSSFERRIVHLVLANDPKVFSESEGEGKDRRVVIKPKS